MTEKLGVRDVLEEAKRVLEKPKSWGKRHLAVSPEGQPVDVHSPQAVKFCLLGAVEKALLAMPETGDGPDLRLILRSEARFRIGQAIDWYVDEESERFPLRHLAVTAFNDLGKTRKRDVLAVLDRAIRLAPIEEKENV